VVVLLAIRTLGAAVAYAVNPTLLQERAGLPFHADQPWMDRLLVMSVLATGFLGLPAIAGLDRFHWHLLRTAPPLLSTAGLVMFALGWGIKGWALRANAFATVVVRLQRERGHVVVERGPYAIVRHPFYAADPLILVGLSLWLESYAAAVCALLPTALMVTRLVFEDRFLRDTLPDYRAYANRVQYRLLPGLW
jgi:protein-S-isoprenylcysteine O-methyltransferase Ste14